MLWTHVEKFTRAPIGKEHGAGQQGACEARKQAEGAFPRRNMNHIDAHGVRVRMLENAGRMPCRKRLRRVEGERRAHARCQAGRVCSDARQAGSIILGRLEVERGEGSSKMRSVLTASRCNLEHAPARIRGNEALQDLEDGPLP
jgi:hypothetical protein